MKKLIAILLAALMLCAMTACTENEGTPTTTPTKVEGYTFTFQGLDLVPGADFDAAALSIVESFENPNCAGEGKFITYLHEGMELTVNTNNGKTVVYSVFITDPNLATNEGLHLGDDLAAVTAAYGEATSEDDGLLTYVKNKTHLVIQLENELVTAIEFRLA
jgi:hypothetical protein